MNSTQLQALQQLVAGEITARPMVGEHKFFPQPDGNPDWCFCRREDCFGWVAYLTWARIGGEPADEVIEAHHRITVVLDDLTRLYSQLLGVPVDADTALALASIEIGAMP